MLSNDQIKEKARPWLQFLDQLQMIGISDKQLPVPQIAVFGDQSSGKSSLLESISGIPFPKGTGLVTRCPTKISMAHTEADTDWTAELSLPDCIDTSNHAHLFQPVKSPIALANILSEVGKLVTGSAENVFSKSCIHVKVRSPSTPDLSLIDLPGIIRTTTVGQDRSVIASVDNLLNEFMEQAETVILAVIPSNQDIATVDILERAHKYDPTGERTIGVLTKPDLVDQGAEEEIMSIVRNVRKPLKLGYILVKNRSQAELKASLPVSDALKLEIEYFETHPIWRDLPASSRGTKSLSDKLTSLIVARAMERAPFIRQRFYELSHQIDDDLHGLGTELPTEEHEKRKMLIRLLSRFTQTLRQVCRGEYRDMLAQHHSELRIKFNISTMLQRLNENISRRVPDLSSQAYEQKLASVMNDMRGRELPGFGSTRLLLSTVAEELDSWRLQVEDTVSQLFELYLTIAHTIADKLTAQFPQLNAVISNILNAVSEIQLQAMNKRVEEMFQCSTEGAATDEELIQAINAIRCEHFELALKEVLTVAKEPPPGPNHGQGQGQASKEKLRAHVIDMMGSAYMQYHALSRSSSLRIDEARAVLTAYWRICEKKIHEDVSQAVDVVLLQQCSEQVERDVLSIAQTWLADHDLLDKIFSEDHVVNEKRVQLRSMKGKVEAASEVLDKLLANGVVAVV
jgi:interferon-induced GTP-binding protein Mx1